MSRLRPYLEISTVCIMLFFNESVNTFRNKSSDVNSQLFILNSAAILNIFSQNVIKAKYMGFKSCVLAVVAKTFVWRWAASIMVNLLHVFLGINIMFYGLNLVNYELQRVRIINISYKYKYGYINSFLQIEQT